MACGLAIVLTGCAGSSPGTRQVPAASVSATPSPLPTISIPVRTPITSLTDVVLPGAAPGPVWGGITWTGSTGLAPTGEMFRWKGGWITQVSPDRPLLADPVPFYVSTDGASWRHVESNLRAARLVAVSGDRLLALSGQGPDTLWLSSDAVTWHKLETSGLDESGIGAVAGGPSDFVGFENSGSIVRSSDGSVWEHPADLARLPVYRNDFEPGQVGSVVFAGERFLVFGWKNARLGNSDADWWSTDGRTWTKCGGETVGLSGLRVFAGRSGLVAQSGSWGFGYSWFRSVDGTSWTGNFDFQPVGQHQNPGDPPRLSPDGLIAGDGDRILAYRWDGVAWTSYDGVTWSRLSVPHNSALDIGKANQDSFDGPTLSIAVFPRGVLLILTTQAGETTQEYGAAR